MKFPNCYKLLSPFLLVLMLSYVVLASSSVSDSDGTSQIKEVKNAQSKVERLKLSQKPQRSMRTRNDPRTGGMVDRIFDSMGLSSITWVPGIRNLMEMNSNGTQMEFVPLGRLLWRRFFGDSATNTLLGL